ncbi:MAG: bifunctional phosphoglucose/phosphomannose isomerase [candidate division Zixibacteria bacterium]|nr:bifunctional phosphoglucose/phosphomannose isomerase [candidate division Zixibacteria bacterium]
MSILDDVDQIRAMDPSNMYNSIFDFAEQMADALKIGKMWKVDPVDFYGIKNIVVVGMGGSAIGSEILRSFLASKLMVPFDICRNYVLPEYVDDESLVIASSYSGNTEETLAAIEDAIERKAMLATITTGGMLADLAKLNEIPMAKLQTGFQPRAALGYSIVPMLIFFEKIGLVKDMIKEVEHTITALQEYREKYIEDNDTTTNPAKLLAEKLCGKIPIIYSGPTITDAVALRWKGQFCENSKTLAYINQFAELNHNELVAWSDNIAPHKDHLVVILLRDMNDHPQIRARMNIVKDIILQQEVEVIDVHSRGERLLERILSLVQLGDFTSYYLAIINKVDPTPVAVIEALKQALRNSH